MVEKHFLQVNDSLLWQSYQFLKQNCSTDEFALLVENRQDFIYDVELAVRTCRRSIESGEIPFEVFCEYILPPKIYDEPFEPWRKACVEEFSFMQSLSIPKICNTLNHCIVKGFTFGG
jgi:hypothetical protein